MRECEQLVPFVLEERKRSKRYDLRVALVGKYFSTVRGQLKTVGLEAEKLGVPRLQNLYYVKATDYYKLLR